MSTPSNSSVHHLCWLVPAGSLFAFGLAQESESRLTSRFSPNQFFLVMVGFGTLAIVWLLTAALALARARQRRFDEHRAWMMRSYSLTFAAATVRLAGLPILVLTRDPIVAITCTFWSWILNLVVAEWFIRRPSAVGACTSLTQTPS